jgi:translocation and assembly module TamB
VTIVLATAASLLALALAGGVLVLRSDWFRRQVHARILREVETATGGRVELGAFEFNWKARHARLWDLTVHGLEKPEEAPLFRAKSVTLGIKIISAWRRDVDLASLDVEQPEVNITVGPDGRTNLPPRRPRAGVGAWERILQLAVDQYRLHQGQFRYASATIPLDVEGRQLDLRLALDRAGRAYSGEFSSRAVRVRRPLPAPVTVDASGSLRLTEGLIEFSGIRLATPQSRAQLDTCRLPFRADGWPGTLACWADTEISVAEWAPRLRLPVEPQGGVRFVGGLTLNDPRGWSLTGRWKASGLEIRGVRGIAGEGSVRREGSGLRIDALGADAMGGRLHGSATLGFNGSWEFNGEASGFPLAAVAAAVRSQPLPWSAAVSGPIRARGPDLNVQAKVRLSPMPSATPVTGQVDVAWDQKSGQIRFSDSFVELPASRLTFSGAPQGIDFGIITRDLEDFSPVVSTAELPVRLDGGQAEWQGRWTGGVAKPRFQGRLTLDKFEVQKRRIERLSTDVDVVAGMVRFARLDLRQSQLRLQGYGSLELINWRPTPESAVAAKLTVDDSQIDQLLRDIQVTWPVWGTATTYLDIQGTYGTPRVAGRVHASKVKAWEENFERVEADFTYASRRLAVTNGQARRGTTVVEFTASADQDDFQLRFDLRNSRVQHWNYLAQRQPSLDGRLQGKASVAVRRSERRTSLTSLTGELRASELQVGERRVGDVVLTTRTRGGLLSVELDGNLRDSRIHGAADWNLERDSRGLGQVELSNLSFATLRDLGFFGDAAQPLTVRGVINAEIGFSGPILRPDLWTALAKVNTLEVEPSRQQANGGKRFVLRNREPLLVALDVNGANLQNVHLVTEGTDLEATGTVAYRARNPWNLRLRGRVDLPVLSAFQPDLSASGVSTVDATIRGSLERPNLTGRMDVKDATVNFRNVPNGLEKLSGSIVFDRTRANIEKLTAQTGGGDLGISGFIDFSGPEWLYRLQTQAQRVRVRYPDPLSVTFNGNVSLTGSTTRSFLTGQLVVSRVGVNPRVDIGGLLAESGRGGGVTSPNEFLRNMLLDLKLETASDTELQTALARDVTPEANLRVRGSAYKPILFGRISANQGEIQFFGNQYTITRGEVSFFNPSKIEPVIDLDLETRVRGVTVNMNFSGPMNRLDVSYRSDPPLQSSEIVALLAVGRAPGSGITPNLPSATQNQALLQPGNNTLLGQAVSAPFNTQLQRLFGVSRIKIDPELTGVTNIPQARLTVEQQLSRDITVTYITNLNRTQQQVVRLQWDFSKDFSVLAVRDENGVFGVDFLWRKRFP